METPNELQKDTAKKYSWTNFFGDVLPAAIDNFQLSIGDLFESVEENPLEEFERQMTEDGNKRTYLVKMPEKYVEKSFKSDFYRAALQEEIDSDCLGKIHSIRYYKDFEGKYLVQFIFDIK